jgi:hypothetical protein
VRTDDHRQLVDDQTIWDWAPVPGIATIELETLVELGMRHGLVAEHFRIFEMRGLVPVQLLRGTLATKYRRLQAENRRSTELVLAHGVVAGINAGAEVIGVIAEGGRRRVWESNRRDKI